MGDHHPSTSSVIKMFAYNNLIHAVGKAYKHVIRNIIETPIDEALKP